MKPASKIKWNELDHFSRKEFPTGSLTKVADELIYKLDEFRELLGSPVTPSPLLAGWVRTSGSKTSQHYAVDRLSTAGDVFLDKDQDARYAFILACQLFKGVGIYYDTELDGEPRVMLHLDLREDPTVWCRYKSEYFYPVKRKRDADAFFYLLNEGICHGKE